MGESGVSRSQCEGFTQSFASEFSTAWIGKKAISCGASLERLPGT